ncbi:hypothetical protein TI04_07870 [Achromatium sp. WMS2]|nr:hypothetical protein TI04_07870 [Achromatium sp. WMS2]
MPTSGLEIVDCQPTWAQFSAHGAMDYLRLKTRSIFSNCSHAIGYNHCQGYSEQRMQNQLLINIVYGYFHATIMVGGVDMRKYILPIAILAGMLVNLPVAEARGYHHRHDGGGLAIATGLLGLGLGMAIAAPPHPVSFGNGL